MIVAVLSAGPATLGADDPETLATKDNLATLYAAARGAVTAQFGPDHPNALLARANLAGLYRDQGEYDRAEPLFAATVRGARDTLGLAHPRTQAYVRSLIECYDRLGRPARA